MFMSGQRYPESWLNSDKAEMSYYTLKAHVQQIMERIGMDRYQETSLQDDVFQYGVRYHRGPQVIVEFGRLHSKLVKGMDIKQPVFFADFNWDNILKSLRKQDVSFSELNKYPRVRRDLALVVGNSVKFDDIASIAKQLSKKILQEVNLFDVYVNDEQLGAGKKSYAVSFIFEDHTKTLKDKEIDKVMGRLISTYETQLGALIRR